MFHIIESLYPYWVGPPEPSRWPEHLRDTPIQGHGQYSFRQGVILGLLLFCECAWDALNDTD